MRVVIAGDSWGAHSYERDYIHPDLKGFKWKEKKKYVLYPGPGDLLKEVLDVEIITTADHGYSNKEALDALEKIVTKEDVVIFLPNRNVKRSVQSTSRQSGSLRNRLIPKRFSTL